MSVTLDETAVVDPRATGALPDASEDTALVWSCATRMAADGLPGMGLAGREALACRADGAPRGRR